MLHLAQPPSAVLDHIIPSLEQLDHQTPCSIISDPCFKTSRSFFYHFKTLVLSSHPRIGWWWRLGFQHWASLLFDKTIKNFWSNQSVTFLLISIQTNIRINSQKKNNTNEYPNTFVWNKTFSHSRQGGIRFNTVNMTLLFWRYFLVHPCPEGNIVQYCP